MNRDKLIARIKALREMTADRGCTEAEAMAAAEKAAALMAEHAIDQDQLEIRDQRVQVKTGLRARRTMIWGAIGIATNCSVVHSTRRDFHQLCFVGIEPGPEIACYLREVCDRAIDQAIAEFKNGKFYKSRRATSTRRAAVEDFTVAMVLRLSRRLLDMFDASISTDKMLAAGKASEAMFGETSTVKRSAHKGRFETAAMEGHDAADRAHLSRGVTETAGPVALIGGRS